MTKGDLSDRPILFSSGGEHDIPVLSGTSYETEGMIESGRNSDRRGRINSMPFAPKKNLCFQPCKIGVVPLEDKQTLILVTVRLNVLFRVIYIFNDPTIV